MGLRHVLSAVRCWAAHAPPAFALPPHRSSHQPIPRRWPFPPAGLLASPLVASLHAFIVCTLIKRVVERTPFRIHHKDEKFVFEKKAAVVCICELEINVQVQLRRCLWRRGSRECAAGRGADRCPRCEGARAEAEGRNDVKCPRIKRRIDAHCRRRWREWHRRR